MARPRLALGEHGEPWVVELPGGGFQAKAMVRDRDGRTRQVSASGATKGAAKRQLAVRLSKRQPSRSTGVGPSMTLTELGQYWLTYRAQHGQTRKQGLLKPQTLAGYADALRLLIVPNLGDVRVTETNAGLLDSVLGDLEEAGMSTAIARSVLSQMLTLAVRHDAIAMNPMTMVARPAREAHEVEVLDLAAVHQLRERVHPEFRRKPGLRGPNRDLADLVDVQLGTGCRIGESLALTWDLVQLDAEMPTARISGTLVEPRRGYVVGLHRQESTKTKGIRTLILPDHVVEVLRTRREQSAYTGGTDPVFASGKGTFLWPNNLRTRLRDATRDDPELVGVSPHTLRRTVGTRIAHEVGLDATREQLGHSDPSVTFQAYVAARPMAPDLRHVLDAFFSTDQEPEG